MTNRQTRNETRRLKNLRNWLVLMAVTLLAFVGLFAGAAHVDQQRGISVDQSLRAHGL